MTAKNLILTTLFVLATGATAADKPAVQARERMEGEARGVTTTLVVAEHGYTGSAVSFAATKPAVAYRLANEAGSAAPFVGETAAAVATGEEHPIANVGYRATAQPQARTVVHIAQPEWNTTATKPAVQTRMRMEEGR